MEKLKDSTIRKIKTSNIFNLIIGIIITLFSLFGLLIVTLQRIMMNNFNDNNAIEVFKLFDMVHKLLYKYLPFGVLIGLIYITCSILLLRKKRTRIKKLLLNILLINSILLIILSLGYAFDGIKISTQFLDLQTNIIRQIGDTEILSYSNSFTSLFNQLSTISIIYSSVLFTLPLANTIYLSIHSIKLNRLK